MTMHITLSNPIDRDRWCEVEAEINRYQQGLFVPIEVCESLGLKLRTRRKDRDYWGPIEIRLGDQIVFSGAHAGGTGVALGFDLLADLKFISSRPTVPLEKLSSLTHHWIDLSQPGRFAHLSPGLTYAADGLLMLIEAAAPDFDAAGDLRKSIDRAYHATLAREVAAAGTRSDPASRLAGIVAAEAEAMLERSRLISQVDPTVLAKALDVFEDDQSAALWLVESDTPALGGMCPADLAQTESGRQQVLAVLTAIEHGNLS